MRFLRLSVTMLAVFALYGCHKHIDFTSQYVFFAKSTAGWELELHSDFDVSKLRHELLDGWSYWWRLKDAKIVMHLKHVRLPYGNVTISAHCWEKMVNDGKDAGAYWNCNGRTAKWNFLVLHAIDVSSDEYWRASISVGTHDFPKLEDCEEFISQYVKANPVDFGIDDDGVSVWMNCDWFKRRCLYIVVKKLTINGENVPKELIGKYRNGAVKMSSWKRVE